MKRKAKRISDQALDRRHKKSVMSPNDDNGLGVSVPPSYPAIQIYFDQKGMSEMAIKFFKENNNKGWRYDSGRRITNWKVVAADWIFDFQQNRKFKLRQSAFTTEV